MSIVKLSKPITAHGDEVSELTLREPTIADVSEIGYPYLVHTSEEADAVIEMRPRVIVKYVSRLAGIPMSSAQQVSLADLSKLQAVVMGFFGEGIAAP